MARSSNVDDVVGDYKPGSIRRIKLKNFLTYSDAVIEPGPRFNMVVGANGTGKSSILCAICLGLGGEPKMLGRADDARSFIMNEKKIALIELEITPHPGKPIHILRRKIDREKGSERGNGRGASTFFLNDDKVNVKEIQQLVKETYHISIDNLCTFLPQDKVGNFSGFDQQSLLLETEKTLSGSQHLYLKHMELIDKEAELNSGEHNVDTVKAKLDKLNSERERFEREKERMEEREKAVEQARLLKTKAVWLKFNEKQGIVKDLKEQRKEMKAKLLARQEEIAPLEAKQAELQAKKAEVEERFTISDKVVQRKRKEMATFSTKCDKYDENIDTALSELTNVDAETAHKQQQYDKILEKVENYKSHFEGLPPKEEIEKEFAEASQEKKVNYKEYQTVKKECQNLQQEFKEKEEKAQEYASKLTKMQDEKAQRKQRILRGNAHLQKISQWLDQNRKIFRRRVWGPIACEVSPKSATAASILDEHVPNVTLKAYVVEDKEDYDLLYNEVREKLKVPINIVLVKNGHLDPFNRIYSDSKMEKLKKEHGVTGYLDESFNAPEPVMQALISYARVNKVLIGGESTQKSIDDKNLLGYLSQPDPSLGQTGLQASCIYASQGHKTRKYISTISRYSKKSNLDTYDIGPARMLALGVSPRVKEELEKKLKSLHEEMAKLRPGIEDAEKKKAELESVGQALSTRAQSAKEAKESFIKIQTRLSQARAKLRDAERDLKIDNSAQKKELIKRAMNFVAQFIGTAEKHGSCHDDLIQATVSSAGNRINKDIVGSAARLATQAVYEKRQEHNELVNQAETLSRTYTKKREELRLLKEENDRIAPLKDEEGNDLPIKAEIEALPYETLEETEAALEEAEQKIQSCHYDPNAIRQYEDTLSQIEVEQAKLDQMQGNKDSLKQSIAQIREPWEAALKNSVTKINSLFVNYMAELGCTGEVNLRMGDNDSGENTGNFKHWGIEIRVSFREGVKAQVLSAQVQSGGERSVSTIMYLMALQEMMVSPFRCVDEINQGLDDRNERLVFKRIVKNSTRPPGRSPIDHAGQYFLITPKLLPNLIDMEEEATTVLFVMNGPHNFDKPTDWDVDVIANPFGRRKRAIPTQEDSENSQNSQNVPRSSSKPNKKRRSVASTDEI